MDQNLTRAIQTIRTFKTPLALMWEAWTNPHHLEHWWGPAGFTSTFQIFDFKEAGEWKMTLHGPDGSNYPNRSIFKEIIPKQKIVFEHFNPQFITTVLFELPGPDEIQIIWTLLFDTPEMRDTIAKVHNAEEGQRQNLDRLEEYLAKQSAL